VRSAFDDQCALSLRSTNSNRKIFAFYEGEDLACCAVTFILALALADNPFENKFTSLKGIYNLIVPPDTDRIRLQWDDKWAERPVFRDVEHTANGVRLSKTKSLQYSKHRQHFIRLGRTCGFEKRLEFYDLRRASGKKLNGTSPPTPPSLLPSSPLRLTVCHWLIM
jgi:hypothetical protein